MKQTIALLAFFASAGAASADQFIATFFNPNHPRSVNITITQMDGAGRTLDTDRRRMARIAPTQSTAAVLLNNNTDQVCITLRGRERATGGTFTLNNGQERPLRIGHEITSNGQQICPSVDPHNLQITIINFE